MLDYKIIGERLKKARTDKGLTQEALSNKINVSIAYLSRIERGSSFISLKRLSQLCELLNISEGQILNGTNIDSKNYLSNDLFMNRNDFAKILNECTEEQKKLIYEIAKVIINN